MLHSDTSWDMWVVPKFNLGFSVHYILGSCKFDLNAYDSNFIPAALCKIEKEPVLAGAGSAI